MTSGKKKNGYLSLRECEVLQWVACGKRDFEIAKDMAVKPETVRTYVKTALRKLEARNKAHATAIALVFGVINLAHPPMLGVPLSELFGLTSADKPRK